MEMIKLEIILENEDLINIINAAVQGGINYWCNQILYDHIDCWTEAGQLLAEGSTLELIDNNDNHYFLNKEKVLTSIEECCGNVPLVIDENGVKFLDTENFDVEIADNIIRKAVGLDE